MKFEPVLEARFQLGEGPHWDAVAGRLTFADIVAGKAYEFAPATGELRSWAMNEPVAAIIPRAKGGYIVAHKTGLSFLDPGTGRFEKWREVDPNPVNRSNETRTDPSGRLWLGTMQNNIGPNGEDLPIERSSGTLNRIEADGRVTCVMERIGVSNTLCWDRARARMYFADTLKNTIWAFDWDEATGEIANQRVHFGPHERGYADGSAIDAEGFLWNARWSGSCIIRITPQGQVDEIIETPTINTTSCVFGGPELKTLYVTSARQGLGGKARRIEGALLAADAPVAGQACTPFNG
jgi:sugar lactone lactonase YvrE